MTMSYRTLKGEVLSGDMFIDCTGRVAKIVAPQTSAEGDADVVTSIPVIHDTNNESMKNYVSPFDMKSGLIAVDAHLMVRSFSVVIQNTSHTNPLPLSPLLSVIEVPRCWSLCCWRYCGALPWGGVRKHNTEVRTIRTT